MNTQDFPLQVDVITNHDGWWWFTLFLPIIAAAAVQYYAVRKAYELGRKQSDDLARKDALRALLMDEIKELNQFLARLGNWTDHIYSIDETYNRWEATKDERIMLLELAHALTSDTHQLTELSNAMLEHVEYCKNPTYSASRDISTKTEVFKQYGRFADVRKEKRAKLESLVSLDGPH